MYHVPEKMRLKKFKNVHIPRRIDLFKKYGSRIPEITSIPDDVNYNPQPNRKLETLQSVHNELYKSYAREKAEEARKALKSAEDTSNQSSE